MRKRIFLFSFIGLSMLALMTGGITLADTKTDIGELFAVWYNRKLNQALLEINRTFQSETEIQTARYRQELQSRLDRVSGELENVKQEEIEKRLGALRSYADRLIANIHAADRPEREQAEARLDAILSEARQAMEAAVAAHYESVSTSTYNRESVTDSVYKQ